MWTIQLQVCITCRDLPKNSKLFLLPKGFEKILILKYVQLLNKFQLLSQTKLQNIGEKNTYTLSFWVTVYRLMFSSQKNNNNV